MFQEEEGEEGGKTENVVSQEQDPADVSQGRCVCILYVHRNTFSA